ncbi:hypothetical protein RI444_22930 (plasmid) [Paenarthrobacter sp. AT5]|jgi:hypothetical protein|uniref:hypothetical protein n=1 Tax=Paenarthrobacter TaxID=1742992 RepID=UPI000AA2A745|nr:hypothetical protein [Paenarthrobacter sp. AT5]WOC63416.1 hypothetical protein RI444_22930 [Paenarthrobacter sp. AT5]
MSAQPGRVRHPDGIDLVLLQGRVRPERRKAINSAAANSGRSVGLYLEDLVLYLEKNGGLPVFPKINRQAEELPIQAAS